MDEQQQEYRVALGRFADRVRRGCASEWQEPPHQLFGLPQDEAVKVRREVVGRQTEESFCE